MRATLVFLALMIAGPQYAAAESLIFADIQDGSTAETVKRRFPEAVTERLPCRAGEETARFVDGVSRCEILRVPRYRLGGYDFSITFSFHESRGVKSAVLRWPRPEHERATAQEIINAYSALLYVSRFGRYVTGGPCSVLSRCQEWQMDASAEWHAGGERIRIEYDPDTVSIFGGVSISYRFADRRSFNAL